MTRKYVHGYTPREDARLVDQATTLTEILHADTVYPAGSRVLEAGCGVGAQSVILARNSPKAHFTSIDISAESLRAAGERVASEGYDNVTFRQADIFDLPFPEESFDHVFVCFVLEHLPDPVAALSALRRVLKRGGSLTVIEGDHGSTFFYPESPDARLAIRCLVDIQAAMGGNALVGRALYPLLREADFREARVSPRLVYVDSSRPELVEGFTRNTFIAMVEGVREQAIRAGMVDEAAWERAIAGLNRTTAPDGTFFYTFMKGTGIR
jgi:ubiquinone/menaquinone biosynthesis C-methylase UbiE